MDLAGGRVARAADDFGAVAPGMFSDLATMAGDPLKDITELKWVKFVMNGGTVYLPR